MNKKYTFPLLAVSAALVLSSCSNTEPTPYKTPSPPNTSQQEQTSTEVNAYGDPSKGGNNPPGQMINVSAGKPFSVDTSNVKLPKKVTEVWVEDSADAPEDALRFLEVSNMIEQRWQNTPGSVTNDDFRPVQALMSPEGWTRLSDAIQSGDQDRYADALVPGRQDGDAIGDGDAPKVPIVRVPQNISFNVAQDEEKFGDNFARLQVDADLYFLFYPQEQGLVTQYKRHVRLYMVPDGDGWVVDNWENTVSEKVS